MRKVREILRLRWGLGLSVHKVAKSCKVSPSTVLEYERRAQAAGLSWPLPEEMDDAVLEQRVFASSPSPTDRRSLPDLAYLLEEMRKPHVTLMLLWMEYKAAHPEGYQYTQFWRYYQQGKRQLEVALRQEHRAGEKLFSDYSGDTLRLTDPHTGEVREVPIFVAVLGASNYTYAEAAPDMTLPHWIGAHIRALEYFGGAPQIIVPDNTRTAVLKPDRYEPDLNPAFADMAAHYGTVIIPARVRKPRDKAKAEAAVLIVERWILAALRTRIFFSLAEMNTAIRELLERLNARLCRAFNASRRELFERLDRPALKPLPASRYEFLEWKRATVGIDYHISVDKHCYSVPYQLVGQQVDVRLSTSTVEVLYRNRRVASHLRRSNIGGFTTCAEHMPKSHQRYLEWTPRCPETHLAPRMLQQPRSWYSLASRIPLHCEVPRMAKTVERGLDWAGLPVIATVARLLCRELTLQNEYLRLENRTLKGKIPGRIRFTDEERHSLAEAALAMGRSLMKEVVSIVKPETILAWQRRLEQKKWDYSERRRRGPGRPRTPEHVAALVCRLARENLWGYQRLRGELLKLRVILSKGCIADILRRNGLPPAPQRAGLTWQRFLSRHAEVMLCADLFTKEVWTLAGLRTAYVLFVLHLGTRRIVLAEATFSPHGQWMGQMARNLLMDCEDLEIAPRFVLHDRDKLLCWDFDAVLIGAEARVVKTPFRAPDANAHAERWVRSVTEECLDHLILFGLGSLQRTLRIYQDFFNGHRPHQGIGNQIPERQAAGAPNRTRDLRRGKLTVECEQFLGGLLNSYYRKAA